MRSKPTAPAGTTKARPSPRSKPKQERTGGPAGPGSEERRFRDLWDNAPVAYHTADSRGIITDVNRTEARMLGYRKDEIIGRPVFDFILPEQRDDARRRFFRKIAGQRLPRSKDRIFLRQDGGQVHVAVDDRLERDAAGEVTEIRSTLVDITKLRASEAALRRSEELYRDLVEKSGLAIIIDDLEGRLVYFNDRYAEMLGYAPAEMKGRDILPTVHPDDAAIVRSHHQVRLRGGRVPARYEFRGVRKDGSVIHLEVDVTVLRHDGRAVGTRSYLRDITRRKQAQEKERESQERFRSLVEHAHDPILLLDDGFQISYLNHQAIRLSGYSPDELLGRDFRAFLAPDDRALVEERYRRRQSGQDTPARYEFDIIRKDGVKNRVEIVSSVVSSASRRPETIVQIHDLTERLRTEAELLRNEARLRSLVEILQYQGSSTRQLLDFALEKAIELSHSRIGYIFLYDDQRRRFVLNSWSREAMRECQVTDSPLSFDLDKTGLLGESVRRGEPFIFNDYGTDHPRKHGCPAGHAPLIKYMSLPVMSGGRCVAAIGLANKDADYDEADVLQIRLLMDAVWKVVESRKADQARRRIEWMLTPGHHGALPEPATTGETAVSDPHHLVALNTQRVILDAIGPDLLLDIVSDFLDMLDTSAVVSEANGDYALSLSSSSWCRFMRHASRLRCGDGGDREALAGGRWRCHESCGTRTSKIAGQTGRPVDVACAGGIRCYAVPIRAGDEIVGAIKMGYGDPPLDPDRLQAIASAYDVAVEDLARHARDYESRPPFIVQLAKHRLEASARLIGEIIERKRSEAALERSLASLRAIIGATVQAIASAVEKRDPYTAGHQKRTADLARAIAAEMGLPADRIEGLRAAGTIHDLGKLSIPAEILSKPTRLTDIEFALIKTHTWNGYEILKDVSFPWPVARIVLAHHARYAGSGYPRGLKGEEILIESRILAVADVIEAIASHRPYRPARGIDEALQEIRANRGAGYDADVVDACLRVFDKGFRFQDGDMKAGLETPASRLA